ncbi:Ig-like domain-containing protein [Sulfurospirillum oryzae]|uniref:Ig-like domain-containing protein n=1 Tax=Sulfurospirillum oryzae TaxID=2976535 RepID=UPI0021E727F5|nr:Ig-like domain-containing protein [Sulfurospirillum oryzae]
MKKILIFMLLCFCFSIRILAGSESEWNGGEGNANTIAINSTTTGTLGNQWGLDVDYFSFTPTTGATTTFSVSSTNTTLELIKNCASGNSTIVATAYSPETIIYNLTGGIKYCLKLSYPTQGADIPYTLTLSSNQAPSANNKFFTTAKDTPLSKNLMSDGGTADSDPDGDTLSATKKTNPLRGTVTLNANGAFTYTPMTGYTGTDNFTYTISDGKGHSADATVIIEVANKTPLANDKSFGTPKNTPLSKNVMNDGGLLDSDPDGDTITIASSTSPAHGTLKIFNNGNFTYTPNTNYIGADSFTYTIQDITKLTATATVRIQVYDAGDEFVPTSSSNSVPTTCGVFEDVLQTHKRDSLINILNNATIISGNCTLNTPNITDSYWQGLTCGSGRASASGVESSAMSIQYDNPPDTSTVTLSSNTSTTDVTVSNNLTLSESFYRKIEFTWTSPHIPLSVDFQNVQKINEIVFTTDNTVTFSTQPPYNLEIGSVGGNAHSALQTKTVPKNIKIGSLSLAAGATVDFEAAQTIQMNTASFARDDSNISLKAQYVKIGSLTQNASGNSGRSYVTIIADYIDIGTLSTGELATLIIKPYTPGKRILFRTNSLSVSSTSTMIVYSGNYYTKAFNVPGTSDSSTIRAADANQLINFFFDGTFAPGNNPGINSNGNKGNYGTLPASNFVLFIKGDFNIGSGGTTFNATIYVEGSANLGTETYIKGALSAGGNINVGNNSQFVYDQTISSSGWGNCTQIQNPPLVLGSVDAIDNYAMRGYTPAQGLRTKIANKDHYTLDVVWLGTGTSPTSYTGTKPMPVRISLSDNACSTDENLAQTTGYVEATIQPGSSNVTTTAFQIISQAKKIAKLRFRFIDWSNLPGGDYSQCLNSSSTLGALQGVPACLNDNNKIVAAFGQTIATQCAQACQSSSYNAGNLPSAPYDNALGCFICLADALNGAKCSTDNFAIRPNDFNSTITANQQFIADKNTSITFRANQYNGIGTTDYNETVNTSFKVDVNISDSTKTCAAPSIEFTPTIIFANGTTDMIDGNITKYSLPNVGDFNLTIHEKIGSEFALVDADDTPDNERYITPYTQQIKVVPEHFLIEGNFSNGSQNFTYLSNFEKYPTITDRNISALLDLNITAQSDLNNTTSNYTSLCYAKDGNITLSTSTMGTTLIGLSKLLWYDVNHDLNGSVALTNKTSYTMNLNHIQFDSTDTNGTAPVKYRINFDRNSTKVVQPFLFQVTDINTSNSDDRNGTKALTNQRATYYYGRVYSTDYDGPREGIATTIRYEAYCDSATLNCSTFGLTTQSPLSIKWYHNPLHVNSDGNVTNFSSIGTALINNANTAISGTIANGSETNTLTNATAPYTDRIQMRPTSWLVYSPFNQNATTNDFNVKFTQTGNWAGEGNLGRTVDVNASRRTSKRMEW